VLIRRLGKLAPEPGGLAVWSMDRFGDVASAAEDLDGVEHPVRLATVGVYVDVGEEER
jgi:hypothetical protein